MVSEYLFKGDRRRPVRPRMKEWRPRCRGLAGRTQAGVQQTETRSCSTQGSPLRRQQQSNWLDPSLFFIRLPAPLLPSASPPRAS